MKISALIAELQKLQALHGDLPVTTSEEQGPPWDHYSVCVPITSAEHCDCVPGGMKDKPHIHLS